MNFRDGDGAVAYRVCKSTHKTRTPDSFLRFHYFLPHAREMTETECRDPATVLLDGNLNMVQVHPNALTTNVVDGVTVSIEFQSMECKPLRFSFDGTSPARVFDNTNLLRVASACSALLTERRLE